MDIITPVDLVGLLISLAALLTGVLLMFLRRQKGIGTLSTLAYALCLGLGAIAWFVLSRISAPKAMDVLKVMLGFFTGYLPAFVFTYVLEYTTQNRRISYWILVAPALIPVVLLGLFAARQVPGFIISGVGYWNALTITPLDAWEWSMPVYATGLLAGSVALLVNAYVSYMRPLKAWRLVPLLGSMLAAILLVGVRFTGLVPFVSEYDLLLAGFTAIGVAILYANANPNQLNLYQLQRAEIFDGYDDGLIVINEKDQMIDMNPAAEQLVGTTIQDSFGKPVGEVLANWNSVADFGDRAEIEFRGSFFLNQERHYLNVRVKKRRGGQGKIITLRDITERRGANEARQLAREEMFNLLQSFFNLANSSQTSSAFFRDVLFQIAFTFHIESGAICLMEPGPEEGKPRFVPMARHGAFAEDEQSLVHLHKALNMAGLTLENKEIKVIPDVKQIPRLAELIPAWDHLSVLVAPLLFDEQFLGCLMLARPQANSFKSDEVARLNIVAEELASFIYFDRQKKSDIALKERLRIVGDLHDSITQKLVVLLRNAETVQIRQETGVPQDINKELKQISGDARQTLREMRLFLHELRPVDMKKYGLVAALHQRIESVEGRADIQARLLIDGEINLPEEKEIEVYYIVEEALNNIIKHAGATSVLITMTRKKRFIQVDLVDNGCGFDPAVVGTGGLGLKNMQERARRIEGKLKLTSYPGNGTKISLRIPV